MRKFNKIFGVGLSRTGTTSLSWALLRLGLKVVHFPEKIDDVFSHHAATDTRIAAQFDVLDKGFPDSLFILTVRNLDDWLHSMERFWAAYDQFNGSPGMRDFHAQLYGAADFDRDTYADAFVRHVNRVKAHFAARPEVFLQMDICAGDGWAKLSPFLEVPMPSIPFPTERAPGAQAI